MLAPRLKAVASEARGFTLPELLVATVLGLLVIGSGVTVFAASMNDQPRITSESNAIQHARVAMERVTRELRQGATVQTATASQLSIATYVHSQTCGGSSASTAIPCRVTYTCTAGACTRTEANPDGTSPGPPVRSSPAYRTATSSPTRPTPSAPTYVGVSFAFADDRRAERDHALGRRRHQELGLVMKPWRAHFGVANERPSGRGDDRGRGDGRRADPGPERDRGLGPGRQRDA